MTAAFLGRKNIITIVSVRPCTRVLLIDDPGVGRYPCSGRLRLRSLRRQLLHGHLEHESGSFVHTFGDNIDLPTAVLHNLLTYSQTHANSVGI